MPPIVASDFCKKDPHFLQAPVYYPMLVASSGFFLAPALYAIISGQPLNATLLILTFYFSANFWMHPIFTPVPPIHSQIIAYFTDYDSFDRYELYNSIDFVLAKGNFAYFYYQNVMNCESNSELVKETILMLTTIATYLTSCDRFSAEDANWQIYHFAFHCQVVYLQWITIRNNCVE